MCQKTLPGFSELIDLQRFERENRRRLCRGFMFAVVSLGLLFLFPPTRPPYVQPPESPRWEIIGDIIELPAPGDATGVGDFASTVPSIPRERLPVFKKPVANYREFLSRMDMRGDEYRKYTDRQIRMLTDQFIRSNAENGRPRDPGFPKWKDPEYGMGRQAGAGRGILRDEIDLAKIDSLGIFGGFVIPDPNDRRNVRGFAYIPSMVRGIKAGYSLTGDAIPGFIEAMKPFTDIELKLAPPVTLTSPEMLRYPLVYISASARTIFELKPADIERFGVYLRQGGFALLDNGSAGIVFTRNDAVFMRLIRDALGDEARIAPIPPDHALFHCYFDIPDSLSVLKETGTDAPRTKSGAEGISPSADPGENFERDPVIREWRERREAEPDRLWGVWLGKRLVAVLMDKGYGRLWQAGMKKYKDPSSETAMELGANLVVFALTQKGGIAVQYAGQ